MALYLGRWVVGIRISTRFNLNRHHPTNSHDCDALGQTLQVLQPESRMIGVMADASSEA